VTELPRDTVMGVTTPLAPGEALLQTWRGDARVYLAATVRLAAILALGVGVVLYAIGNGDILVGALGAVLAIGARGWFLASEALAFEWRLTDRRLLGPGGKEAALPDITRLRMLFGDVQVVTRQGDKHLIRHMARPQAVIAAIESAKARR